MTLSVRTQRMEKNAGLYVPVITRTAIMPTDVSNFSEVKCLINVNVLLIMQHMARIKKIGAFLKIILAYKKS